MEAALNCAASRCRQQVIVRPHTWANLQESQRSLRENWEGGVSQSVSSGFSIPPPPPNNIPTSQATLAWETAGTVCVCVCVRVFESMVLPSSIHVPVPFFFFVHDSSVKAVSVRHRGTDAHTRAYGRRCRKTGGRTERGEADRTAESCQWWNDKHLTHTHMLPVDGFWREQRFKVSQHFHAGTNSRTQQSERRQVNGCCDLLIYWRKHFWMFSQIFSYYITLLLLLTAQSMTARPEAGRHGRRPPLGGSVGQRNGLCRLLWRVCLSVYNLSPPLWTSWMQAELNFLSFSHSYMWQKLIPSFKENWSLTSWVGMSLISKLLLKKTNNKKPKKPKKVESFKCLFDTKPQEHIHC